jgi:outer membrane protein TolC
VQTLNRLRARSLDEPIPTTAKLREVATPPLPDLEGALADAQARSPELAVSRLGVSRAQKQVDLARREKFPDFSVTAGVMPRGALEPMWQAGVSVGLPVWSYRKQGRAVVESEARASADARNAEAIEQILKLRVAERRTALAALLDTLRLYREGLLVQSLATAESTLAQYRVGKVTFASVLDANAGYINDEEGYLLAIAEAQRIVIAGAEVTLDPVGVTLAGGGMGGAAVPGAGAVGGSSGMSGGSPGAGAAPAEASSSSSSM